MGFFKKKKPEPEQPQPQRENPAGQMDPSIRPGGVFMVQLLMKEKCETPGLERMAQALERHIGRVEAAGPSGHIRLFSALGGKLSAAVERVPPCPPKARRGPDRRIVKDSLKSVDFMLAQWARFRYNRQVRNLRTPR